MKPAGVVILRSACACALLIQAACQAQSPQSVRVGDASAAAAINLTQGLPSRPDVAAPQEPPAGARPQIAGPPDLAAAHFDREPALLQRSGTSRLWADSGYAWEAPALCHRPLYFEDVNLERHGRSHGLAQPAVSAVHFAGRIAAWPYMAGAFPPHECIYTLRHDRPGTYTPYCFYRPPVSLRGAIYEAGAVAGLAYLVP